MQRRYSAGSTLSEGGLILDLAPGLGDTGIDETPQFFHGFARHPLVLARGLLTLAEITRTRYFRPEPQDNRDPVLTAGGDVLRAECFSACNGVYARFDLHGEAFEAGTIGHGTTNVDLGPATVNMLGALPRTALLHLDIGAAAMTVSTPDRIEYERKVNMPDRWIPALGNVSALMEKAQHRFTVGAAAARRALAGVPTSNTGRDK
ncbi:hypothetical protein [Corynebacterium sp.]|uniref:hypothetical protein n=1 Tax=Corynebacterium sp. TaxID=1720 RepID=UPI0028A9C585|nr:hypothetical protein [Corynebacterium sp.]